MLQNTVGKNMLQKMLDVILRVVKEKLYMTIKDETAI